MRLATAEPRDLAFQGIHRLTEVLPGRLEAAALPEDASEVVEAGCDDEAVGCYPLVDGKRSIVEPLRRRQITAAFGDVAEVVQAARDVEAVGCQPLVDRKRSRVERLSCREVTPVVGNESEVVEAGCDVEAVGCAAP